MEKSTYRIRYDSFHEIFDFFTQSFNEIHGFLALLGRNSIFFFLRLINEIDCFPRRIDKICNITIRQTDKIFYLYPQFFEEIQKIFSLDRNLWRLFHKRLRNFPNFCSVDWQNSRWFRTTDYWNLWYRFQRRIKEIFKEIHDIFTPSFQEIHELILRNYTKEKKIADFNKN